MVELKKISKNVYEIPKVGKMNVPVRAFVSEKLLESIRKDETFKQAVNVSSLPGLVKNVILCPDSHMGYGMPIGGVAAFDLKKGVMAPGMVGFDINCGVRVLATNITKKEFMKKRKEILHDIKRTIPSGVGRGGEKYSKETIKEVLIRGSEWAYENGFATKEDLEHTEENGKIRGADPKDVSDRAIVRGLPQLGTLGAGNHFIDIQVIEEIFNKEIAKVFGLNKNNICIMIHCGSRGLGHQVASDYLRLIEDKYGFKGLPDRELVNAPINSDLGKKYFSAMKCAVNFAFCNRQIIMHKIRDLLKKHYPKLKTNLVYDIAHNISKVEKYEVDGKEKEMLILRKGATRSLGPGRKEIPKVYRNIGQPVLIPGSMSTPSFVLVGTKKAEEKSFGSSAHGAGRAHSRMWAHKKLNLQQLRDILNKKDILLEGSHKATIEESEFSYKDVEEVINITESVGLGEKVAKLKPLAVMIG
ncbi:MAG: RtcB family protein [archaeon]